MLVFAKAYVAAAVLEHRLLAPQWMLNAYRLDRQLGIRRSRMATAHIAALARAERVTEEMFLSTGESDYGEAIRVLASDGRFDRASVLVHEGMWGGWRSVETSRSFVRSRLYAAPNVVPFLATLKRRASPTIGVHIRRGDFAAVPPGPGDFNKALPLEWYADVMNCFRRDVADVNFVICSDASEGELAVLLADDTNLVRGSGQSAPVQEVMALASTDVLIASVSSFSMLAAFISARPYIWYSPQLTQRNGSGYVWNDRYAVSRGQDEMIGRRSTNTARGIPAPFPSGHVPGWLVSWLRCTADMRRLDTDLLMHGRIEL